MSDNIPDSATSNSRVANTSSNGRQIVDLFPALSDKRMLTMSSMRPAPTPSINTQISIFSPVSFDEAIEIVECLRCRAATTISLENMKKLDAKRLVDFVAGASAALDGDFHKLSEQVYIFCPSNIKITADLEKDVAHESEIPDDIGALDFLYPTASKAESGAGTSPWLQ
ncbi:MAG TPA: cell division protein SepF [Candidatus Melainabacteria bacterium]|nr:cell division protein SepF [Candidatus Melainabacteria bacterium]HMP50512.1 cell division protein SepF [Candidatus Melainabacteria bacterium]